jgi:hypothetical protein
MSAFGPKRRFVLPGKAGVASDSQNDHLRHAIGLSHRQRFANEKL